MGLMDSHHRGVGVLLEFRGQRVQVVQGCCDLKNKSPDAPLFLDQPLVVFQGPQVGKLHHDAKPPVFQVEGPDVLDDVPVVDPLDDRNRWISMKITPPRYHTDLLNKQIERESVV